MVDGHQIIAVDDPASGKIERLVTAARRKVHADDALFLATTGKIASDFARLGDECKAADHELQKAVRALDE